MSHTLLVNPTAFEAGLLSVLNAHTHDIDVRRAAFEEFAKTGLPHRRLEAWKWTDLRAALQQTDDRAQDRISLQKPSVFHQRGAFTITLDETGAHWGDAVPAGVTLRVTDEVAALMPLVEHHPMANLVTALASETLIIAVADGAEVTAPIHLYRANAQQHACARVLVSLGEGASLTVMDSFEANTDDQAFNNLLVEARVRENASLTRIVLNDGGDDGVDTALHAVTLAAGSQFHQYGLLRGSKRSRTETILHFTGPGAEASSFTAAMLSDNRHADMTTHSIHDAEECIMEQHHKSVVSGRATSVFQGKFLVERSGQKTDANMQANAMLLSSEATVQHKPELEIYADDVLCAHGSTSGALDDEALFYLRQRGLNESQARGLLVEAFLGEVFDACPLDGATDIFRQQTERFLKGSVL